METNIAINFNSSSDDTKADDERILQTVSMLVPTCEKALKQSLFLTNENSSSIPLHAPYQNESNNGFCDGSVSWESLKSNLDRIFFNEEEYIDQIAKNKELQRLYDLSVEKHKAEKVQLMSRIDKCKEDLKNERDRNAKLQDEINYFKSNIIPNMQDKNAATEKERDFLRKQLQFESIETSVPTNNNNNMWKEKYQSEKIKNFKLTIKIRGIEDQIRHDNDKSALKNVSRSTLQMSLLSGRDSDHSGNMSRNAQHGIKITPVTNTKNRRKKMSSKSKQRNTKVDNYKFSINSDDYNRDNGVSNKRRVTFNTISDKRRKTSKKKKVKTSTDEFRKQDYFLGPNL
jgi:hypothetical protein